ncbi:MAG: EamA family transporter [Solirubrobacteraceae bacterium]|nr:EamA family transporter [Solirubrobacteraceae bacterium]
MSVPTDRVRPEVLVFGSIVSVQFGAGLAATLFDDLGPAGAALLRLGISGVLAALIWRPRPSDFREPGALRLAVVYGVVLGLMNFVFYEALDRIPLGIAVTLEFAGPLGVAVALSRKRLDVLWVTLAAAGIILLGLRSGGAGGLDPWGVVFALLAGVCWGAYILLAQPLGARVKGNAGLALGMIIAAMVPIGPGIAQAGDALLEPSLLAQGAAVALLSSLIPYTLEFAALRRMSRRVFGIFMSLEPAVAALAGFVVLHQSLSGRDLVAIGLVVAASIGAATEAGVQEPVP